MRWIGDPKQASQPVREYLAALEEINDPKESTRTLSLTDLAVTWMAAPGGPAFLAYCTNYLIDLEAGIILDVEASKVNKAAEAEATRIMIDWVEEKFDLKPERLVGDTNYGSAAMLGWLVDEKGIEPHVPVFDKSERTDGTFGRSDFTYDAEHNRYTCPAGKFLKTSW